MVICFVPGKVRVDKNNPMYVDTTLGLYFENDEEFTQLRELLKGSEPKNEIPVIDTSIPGRKSWVRAFSRKDR